MSVKDILGTFVNEELTIVMSGLNSSMTGTLVTVDEGWFTMKTATSDEHYFDMSKLNSWYPVKPKGKTK